MKSKILLDLRSLSRLLAMITLGISSNLINQSFKRGSIQRLPSRTKLKVVFKHVGTELLTQKRFTSEETYARNNDFETPNDGRNNDFETPNDVNFDANNAE